MNGEQKNGFFTGFWPELVKLGVVAIIVAYSTIVVNSERLDNLNRRFEAHLVECINNHNELEKLSASVVEIETMLRVYRQIMIDNKE